MQAVRTVVLAGELGKRYGRTHRFAIATPAEAIKALCANFKDFAKHLCESEQRGMGYRVVVDKAAIDDASSLHNPFSQTVRIVPVLIGAGSGGFGQILLGAVLIGATFMFPATFATVAFGTTTWGSIAFGIGASMILGGVASMLSPVPKASTPSEREENKPSYSFNGPVNTTQQGHCVPLGYGRGIVGSAQISAGITSDDYEASGMA